MPDFLSQPWMFAVVAALLVLAIIIYVTVMVVKDKKAKKRLGKEREELKRIAAEAYISTVLDINEIIENNQKKLDKFVVSVGTYKMSDITNTAAVFLKETLKTDVFKTLYKNSPDYGEFYKNTEILANTKSNSWQKKLPQVIEYFANIKADLQISDEELSKKSHEANKRINDYFEKSINSPEGINE